MKKLLVFLIAIILVLGVPLSSSGALYKPGQVRTGEGLENLKKDYRFIYYHQRGCGHSTRPIDTFKSQNFMQNVTVLNKVLGLSAQLADIERIRRILGHERLILVGHSYGGFLASLYAAEFPEHVEKPKEFARAVDEFLHKK